MDTPDEARQIIYKTETAEFPGAFDLTLLSDINHKVIDEYGIYNPLEEATKPGIPYPTVYIINKEGVVTEKFQDTVNYERPSDEQLRAALLKIGAIKTLLPE